jgi:regulator of protease activity HflC (stomatin/prohibitin superfamily)
MQVPIQAKKMFIFGLCIVGGLIVVTMLANCFKRIDPGYVGIEVNYYGSQKGVQDFPVRTGMAFFNPVTTAIMRYPSFVQTAVWTRSLTEGRAANEEITFNSKEGMVISGDISLSYQLNPEKVPSFYVKFRTDDLETFTHGFLRNIARDAFNEVGSTLGVQEIYGDKKEVLLTRVRDRINQEVSPYGVVIQQFGFIGAPRLPEGVVAALNAKITATQDAIRAENELRKTKAEADKAVAKAKGESDANIALAASITPNLIRWREMDLTARAIEKWDGRRPTVEGNSAGLMLSLPK